jgi:hypothetical protein
MDFVHVIAKVAKQFTVFLLNFKGKFINVQTETMKKN